MGNSITAGTPCQQTYNTAVFPVNMTVVVVSGIICHICCTVRAWKSGGGRMQKDLFVKAQLYLGNCIFSYSPLVLQSLHIIPQTLEWKLVVNCLANLNGAANAFTYWLYLRSFMPRVSPDTNMGSPMIPPHRDSLVSVFFRVTFRIEPDQVIEVESSERDLRYAYAMAYAQLPAHADWVLGVADQNSSVDKQAEAIVSDNSSETSSEGSATSASSTWAVINV